MSQTMLTRVNGHAVVVIREKGDTLKATGFDNDFNEVVCVQTATLLTALIGEKAHLDCCCCIDTGRMYHNDYHNC